MKRLIVLLLTLLAFVGTASANVRSAHDPKARHVVHKAIRLAQPVITPPIFIPPAGGGSGDFTFSLPTGHSLHFMTPTGSDSNDGLAPTTGGGHGPWLTTNHALSCGDLILAGTGAYDDNSFQGFATVSNCPSTSGGIDGTGGIYFAVVLCAGPDLVSCTMDESSSNSQFAVDVANSNWAIEGFQVSGFNSIPSKGAFIADGSAATIHHTAFINNVAFGVGIGFAGIDNGGLPHDVPGATGFDYYFNIGNIAQNAQKWTGCTAAIVGAGPATVDTVAGTHQFFYGNFSYNHPNNGCATDIEAYMFDTWDAHGYNQQSVMMNNIGWSAYRMGVQLFFQDFNPTPTLHDYLLNNTLFSNNIAAGGFGELNFQQNSDHTPIFITANKNIGLGTLSSSCGVVVGNSDGVTSALANIVVGQSGAPDVLFSTGGGAATCYFNGYTGSGNVINAVNPLFTNTSDLLTNRSGAPNCTGFENTTECMGWNARTSTLTIPSVISDLTPTCTLCAGMGYQRPSTTCVNSGDISTYYPVGLKGIVYLHASGFTLGATITEKAGLVTKPCNM